ncbi:MAG: choline ABC transporter permease subunit [Maritimibacter sp.]
MNWLTDNKIPIGKTAENGFDWLKDKGAPFFDWLAWLVEGLIETILTVLQSPLAMPRAGEAGALEWTPLYPEIWQPFPVILAFTALTYALQRRVFTSVLVFIGFLFILNQGYWEETTESLALVLSACVVCMGIGVPLGIFLAHHPRLYAFMRPILDLMQTLPTFVYLIPAIVFFGIGPVPGLIATVIFVLPAPIRLTQLGIASTPVSLKETASAFGATPRQLLWKVELPFALPQIMAGLNQTIMLSLSMVVIAALVGADGLGVPVVRALNTVNTSLGFESGMIIVVVAIVLDRMLRIDRK